MNLPGGGGDATVVFVCGYSCGLRPGATPTGPRAPIPWPHPAKNFDLCWTCACYLTDDGSLKYMGYTSQSNVQSPITSPQERPSMLPLASLLSPTSVDIRGIAVAQRSGSETCSTTSPVSPVSSLSADSDSDGKTNENGEGETNARSPERRKPVVKVTEDDSSTWTVSSVDGDGFCRVACGWSMTVVLSNLGKCLLWKDMNFKKPMLPAPNADELHLTEISLGDLHSAALTSDGQVYELQVGQAVYSLNSLVIPMPVTQVSCGKEHVLMLTKNGMVYSYGLGSRGQLGHGSCEPEQEPRLIEALEGITISDIAAGGWHSAALDASGALYMWGWNESGQLGQPCSRLVKDDEKDKVVAVQSIPTLLDFAATAIIVKVSLGSRHSAAVTDAGELWTWGWNGYAQLCMGDTKTRDSPTRVEFFTYRHKRVRDVRCRDWSTIIWV